MEDNTETGVTITYDDSVSWCFHESYYEMDCTLYVTTVDNNEWGSATSKTYHFTCYLFALDDFGDNTYTYVKDFADNYGYLLWEYDNCYLVVSGASDYKILQAGESIRKNPDYPDGTVYMSVSTNKQRANWYIENKGFPSATYPWKLVSSDDVSTDEETTDEDEIEVIDQNESEKGNSDISSDNDSNTDIINDIDVDSLESSDEILKEILKNELSYEKESLQLQQDSFNVGIVNLSLNFCIVFLCGVLVGCMFAKSLWHKMNVG